MSDIFSYNWWTNNHPLLLVFFVIIIGFLFFKLTPFLLKKLIPLWVGSHLKKEEVILTAQVKDDFTLIGKRRNVASKIITTVDKCIDSCHSTREAFQIIYPGEINRITRLIEEYESRWINLSSFEEMFSLSKVSFNDYKKINAILQEIKKKQDAMSTAHAIIIDIESKRDSKNKLPKDYQDIWLQNLNKAFPAESLDDFSYFSEEKEKLIQILRPYLDDIDYVKK